MLSSLYDLLKTIYDTNYSWLNLYLEILSVVILTFILLKLSLLLFNALTIPFKIVNDFEEKKPTKRQLKKQKKDNLL